MSVIITILGWIGLHLGLAPIPIGVGLFVGLLIIHILSHPQVRSFARWLQNPSGCSQRDPCPARVPDNPVLEPLETTSPPHSVSTDEWRQVEAGPGVLEVQELGDPTPKRSDSETQALVIALRLELAEARAIAEALQGPAVARISGRAYEWKGRTLVLAVADQDGYQRIGIRVLDEDDRESLALGMDVELVASWTTGRLTAKRIVSAEVNQDPLPELPEVASKTAPIPVWFDSQAKNEKRPLLKAADGSSSVSELRVHLIWATKRRGAVLTAAMVDRLKALTAEVVAEKKLGQLLAVNGEEDHVHVALWLPANLAGSEAAGVIKSYTSRLLRKEFPELLDHDGRALWQRGCYVGSIGQGGDLAGVLRYIADQNAPQAHEEDQEGGEDDDLD